VSDPAPPPPPPGSADSPGIRILPPLVYLGAFGLGGLADRLRPWPLAESWVALERWRWLGVALLAGALAMDRCAIPREERYLERRFGAAYLDYRRRVRRWL
jgi:protein-S-isoprenylcysteine O-methyltransferase Ste14